MLAQTKEFSAFGKLALDTAENTIRPSSRIDPIIPTKPEDGIIPGVTIDVIIACCAS